MNRFLFIFILLFLVSGIFASNPDSVKIQQLENRIKTLEKKIEKAELEDLRESAQRFQEAFFSDPSFLLTSTLMGYRECLAEKITVAKEYVSQKRSARLRQLMDETRAKLIRLADSTGPVIDRVLEV